MLGTAVYLGTFWKAFRFGTLTQDYKKRPGAIMRVYCFPKKLPLFKTVNSERCKCEKCLKGLTDQTNGTLCDHLGLWQKVTDLVIACPGGPIKNEESAVTNSDILFIDSVAHCTSSTEHHEPLSRNLSID
jgi:hypothetical protein